MRAEIHRSFPELAKYIQPKCGDKRWGYCDESLKDWQACPIGRKRPHKKQLFELFDAHRRGELAPLAEGDFQMIEEIGSSVATAGNVKASQRRRAAGHRAGRRAPGRGHAADDARRGMTAAIGEALSLRCMSRALLDHVIWDMGQAFDMLFNNLKDLRDDDWNFVPEGGARSIRAIVGHVASCKLMYDNHAFGDASMTWEDPRLESRRSRRRRASGSSPEALVEWLRTSDLRLAAERRCAGSTTRSWRTTGR